MAVVSTMQGWRLPARPLPASSPHCGGIHTLSLSFSLPHSVARSCSIIACCLSLTVSVFSPARFFPYCTFVSLTFPPCVCLFLFSSVSVCLFFSSCLCGPPLGWLLLAAPVPPTLSLDMLFIGLQRGWLSLRGGCCLKQCSLNKRGRRVPMVNVFSLSFSVQTPSVPSNPITTISPLPTYSHLGERSNSPKTKNGILLSVLAVLYA